MQEIKQTLCSVTLFDGRVYSAMEDVTKDWKYYSKAYHRKNGPKITISNRRVVVTDTTGTVVGVEATLKRWPTSKLKGTLLANQYLAILNCLPVEALPPLLGLNRDLDDVLKLKFSRRP